MKIDTVVGVSRSVAALVMLCYAFVDVIFLSYSGENISFFDILLKGLLLGILTFALAYYVVGRLIHNRLNVIYKLIRNNRLNVPSALEEKSADDMLDLTEKDVKEWSADRLSKRQKEELLKKYRQEFTGNISHELKTPLFSVQGYVHTLLDGAMNDPVLTKRYLKKTVDNIDRLSEIIEALSTISQFESGQMIMEVREFNLRDLVVGCVEELRHMLKEKKVTVEISGDEFHAIMVYGDPRYIRQVLINLISNSIRYGKKNGNTKIDFSTITGQYLVEIVDDGIGIEAQHLEHIFDRFYRVDYGRSRKEGGSGVGLAIVKHIINAHGQRIQVSSEFGVGSNFSFTLRKA